MIECEHGQLARACNICEYEREIAELKARVGELEAALRRETNEYIEASHTLVIERDEARGQIRELEAENQRLREALDRIESMATIENTEIQKIAREALKEDSHDG